MRTVSVAISEQDIRAGKRGDCFGCPVAMAAARATGRPASVGQRWLILPHLDIELPLTVQAWIKRYDRGLDVTAFVFDITVPG